MAPREKRPRQRGTDEEFVLFLQGIPAHCRWQELKDLVRQTALHIRQAVVYDDHHGFPTGLGQIIVKNEEEAWRTYHRLSTNGWESQSLVVTLSRTCAPTRPVAGPTKSPASVFSSGYVSGHSTPPRVAQNMAPPSSPISPEPIMPTTPTYPTQNQTPNPEYAPIIGLPLPPPPSFIPVFADAISPPVFHATPTTSFCDPSSLTFSLLPPSTAAYPLQPQQPVTNIRMNGHHAYPGKSMYSNSHIHSHSNGYIPRPSRRAIHIQNLSPHTTQNDLVSLFGEAGSIEQCQIDAPTPTATPNESYRYNNKNTARITFTTADEAKRAVSLFNNVPFMGAKRVRVRVDRGGPGPGPGPGPGYNTNTSPVSSTSTGSGSGSGSGSSNTSTTSSSSVSTEPGLEKRTESLSLLSVDEPEPKPKPVDRCQPLVVNGSGVGRNANPNTTAAVAA